MSEPITIGKLLLKHNVPDHLKSYVATTPLDKKGLGGLFSKLADQSPHDYKQPATALTRLGFEVATRLGSTVPMSDLSPFNEKDKAARFDKLDSVLDKIEHSDGSKRDKIIKKTEAYEKFTKDFEDELMSIGTKNNHTLTNVMKSGARGTMQQYRQTVGSPILVTDDKGAPILDYPIRHSFAEGLTIPEYLLHSYGTRRGAIGTKLAIADSGYFSKQLSRAAMPIKIEEHDCGTDNGIMVPITDKDSIGTFLAHPVSIYKKNNEVTSQMLAELSNKKIAEIVVRSPITCQSSRKHHAYAVCQLCAGKREKGLPTLNSYIGVTSGTALGEPLNQGQLNTKHSSSSAVLGKTVATGFKLIQQLANIPKTFQNKAVVVEHDGKIDKIRAAPQGGTYIDVGTQQYYVPAGFKPHVSVGDHVEAGDVISEGIVNPSEIVEHKGIGEGRHYFANAMRKAFDDSGMGVNRRNFEIIAKGAVDHVRIAHPEGLGDHLPDAIVSYQTIEKSYKPRETAQKVRTDLARGQFLEEPILHYTIGTRVTSRVVDALKRHKIDSVLVHHELPPFVPEMQRLLDVPGHVPDWAHQLYSTYLEKRLIHGVNSGMSSSLQGPSPVLGLAYGKDFGIKQAEVYDDTGEEA